MYDLVNTFCGLGLAYPIGKYIADENSAKMDWNAILKKLLTLPQLLGMLFGLFVNLSDIELVEMFYVL